LIPFTLQMVMMLLGGYVVATSRPVHGALRWLTARVDTPAQAVVVCALVSIIACWVHWGFGLVVAAFTCREMIKQVPLANYRLLVAAGYGGFIVWHGGLSGSIPLLLATPGNFSQELMGGVVPLSITTFSTLNLVASVGLLIIIPATCYAMAVHFPAEAPVDLDEPAPEPAFVPTCFAERLENSRLVSLLLVGLAVAFLWVQWSSDSFIFDLNRVNFLFLFLGILLHGRLRSFLNAVQEVGKKLGPILVQYPFYAGIMGMMEHSGLAAVLSEQFVAISTATTFPLFTFFSAGLVNFFVPSGGGQWAVQSTIVIPAAKELGVDTAKAAMAIAWGDAWTNLAQPFWALPLLAIAGLKVRDIIGYCVTLLIVSGIFLSLIFLIL
jgi:short-chain fatty acids transporter